MLRINPRSPEWLAIKELLETELKICVENLLNPRHTEVEYHQWRGRAALANKLLGLDKPNSLVTDKGE